MKIATQGHLTRGEEIIQILESLGGKKLYYFNADDKCLAFFIDDKGYISCLHCENPILKEYYKIYTLKEFEKEFPFKIGDKVMYDYASDSIGIVVDIKFDDNIPYRVNIKGTICTCGTNTLKPYKMANSRNITLTLDKAKEWYQKGGELKEIALQAFTKEELNPLPKSWGEYCKGYKVPAMIFGPCIPNKYVALWKLEQLRDCYRQGWKPNWTDCYTEKYCIILNSGKLVVSLWGVSAKFLAFQSREVTEEFLKNFDRLIKEAEDFI